MDSSRLKNEFRGMTWVIEYGQKSNKIINRPFRKDFISVFSTVYIMYICFASLTIKNQQIFLDNCTHDQQLHPFLYNQSIDDILDRTPVCISSLDHIDFVKFFDIWMSRQKHKTYTYTHYLLYNSTVTTPLCWRIQIRPNFIIYTAVIP